MEASNSPQFECRTTVSAQECVDAIVECNSAIRKIKTAIGEYRQNIDDLGKRKRYYEGLVEQGKFNRENLLNSICGMDVEVRRYEDRINLLYEDRKRYRNVIQALELRLEEIKLLEEKLNGPEH